MEQIEIEIQNLKTEILDLKKLIVERDSSPDFITKEILTAEDTIQLLGCSRHTFDRLRKEGTIKVYQLRRRLYTKYSEILEAIDNGLIEPTIH